MSILLEIYIQILSLMIKELFMLPILIKKLKKEQWERLLLSQKLYIIYKIEGNFNKTILKIFIKSLIFIYNKNYLS